MGTFFIIVLDKNDADNGTYWYVTASSATLEPLQKLKDCNDNIVMTLSKALYPGNEMCQITLLNNQSNQSEPGKIREVHHV